MNESIHGRIHRAQLDPAHAGGIVSHQRDLVAPSASVRRSGPQPFRGLLWSCWLRGGTAAGSTQNPISNSTHKGGYGGRIGTYCGGGHALVRIIASSGSDILIIRLDELPS